ncbi:Mitochondrial chaperone BCS1-like protein, partial [Dinothrombium tinctorium]
EINQHNDFENKDGELQNKEDKFNSKPKKTNQRNYNDNINSNLGAEEEKITDSSKSIQNENLIIEKISISCQASNSHSKQTSARDNNKKVEHNVSFSAFINMLDGIASKEGLVIMMTTNNINALDSTFLRAGRIDRLQKIDYPSDYQIKELFCRFYPNASPILAEEFVRKHKATKRLVSVAEIQGHLLTNKFDPIRAITSLNRGI